MNSLMKLTSLLLVETLSDSDYIMVNIANTSCTNGVVVPANLSQRQSIENCIATNLNVISVCINSSAVCQEINRYKAMVLMYIFLLF